MINLAIFVYDISLIGGAERVAINMANELMESYNVVVISLFCEKTVNGLKKDVKHIVLEEKKASITKYYTFYINDLKRALKTYDIQVVISITAGVVSLAVGAVRKTRTKVIYAEHSNLENKTYGKKHIIRQWLGANFADLIVTLTERDRTNFIYKFHIHHRGREP